ncbi:tripartite-type tricarboxylate transporter receptor subunit TctC [Blastococcus colisei]|uniref:Tripartite-type tricarboxylate transporter receptor subunit TctC n=1 Tax=Blastococcus colisei TaxID=1564162 RepID=A0A543P1T2_9ACTN|nr:tripartite tricarboxylate transporter substrate binding protein [Blastococcus colisei]TQN38021.1 tripartite-type tricarboxylate transporter receptor subunit TctC [Blastococcus colisei]
MTRHRLLTAATAAGALLLAGCGSGGDDGSGSDNASGGGGSDFPSREIAYIIPYDTGGSTDPIGRQHAQGLEECLGGSVIVENQPGASATIGTGAIVTADPDGHTIGMTTSSAVGLQPLVMGDQLPYDSAEDYQPLIKLADLPTVLTVRADSPWQDIEDLVAAAEQDPGAIRVSVSGAGTTPDLNVQQLNQAAGIELTSVPFTGGGGEALVALLGGEVEANAGYAPSVQAQVEAGELRVIGVFYDEEYYAFPDAQTTSEAGYDDAALPVGYYSIAPNDLPDDVLEELVSCSEDVLATDEFQSFAEEQGYIYDPITTDEVREDIQSYRERYQPLLDIIGG